MSKIEILDEKQHRELNIDFKVARLGSRKTLIPVVISEFHLLMFHYPIVFVKDVETGEFACSILLGVSESATLLDQAENQCEENLPLNVRRLPLVAVASRNKAEGPLIGINKASAGVAIGDGDGDYIFQHTSEAFESAMAALGELYEGYSLTKAYVEKVIKLDLISKLQVEIRHADKPPHILEGLYGIDLNKIAHISQGDGETKDLFLEVASYVFAQNFSLFNMKKLVTLVS